MWVIFDVVGTLFSPEPLRGVFKKHHVPEWVVDVWFARLFHAAFAATLAGRYRPYRELGDAALRQVLAARGLDEAVVERALESLPHLPPWEDARACLEALCERGHRLAALTNGGPRTLDSLLRGSGLAGYFALTMSADEIGACKPDPRPYRRVLDRARATPGDACMVAAHGWDVLGADAAGLRTVWMRRLEKRWPFPGRPPGATVDSLAEVPAVLEG